MKETGFEKTINTVTKKIKQSGFIKKILVFDTVSSTNSTAKELAEQGELEGTLVVARTQSKGKGRFERIWESPEGGLYLSLILRPSVSAQQISLLPLITALAVSKTIRSLGLFSTIKWPNDVRVNNKKIAGILLEAEFKGTQVQYVVVGIGINVNINLALLPQDIIHTATSLSQELGKTVKYDLFLAQFISAFHHEYTKFLKGDSDSLRMDWKTHTDTLGTMVKIITSSGEIIGKAVDIDKAGFLIVLTNDGSHKTITSGDCLYLNEL